MVPVPKCDLSKKQLSLMCLEEQLSLLRRCPSDSRGCVYDSLKFERAVRLLLANSILSNTLGTLKQFADRINHSGVLPLLFEVASRVGPDKSSLKDTVVIFLKSMAFNESTLLPPDAERICGPLLKSAQQVCRRMVIFEYRHVRKQVRE